jgi:PIN domain
VPRRPTHVSGVYERVAGSEVWSARTRVNGKLVGKTFELGLTGRSNCLNLLEAQAEAVRVYFKPRPLSTSPNDDMVLDVAISGKADVIVTFNTKHFESSAA